MPVQAPKCKYEHQGHVLSRAVFVTSEGCSASIYMANTMKWKGAKENEKSEQYTVAVKVSFPLCTWKLEGPGATEWQLTCCKAANHNNKVYVHLTLSVFWEACTFCHNGRIISGSSTFLKYICFDQRSQKRKTNLSFELLSGRIFRFCYKCLCLEN